MNENKKIYNPLYYRKNIDKIKARWRIWYDTNFDAISKRRSEHHANMSEMEYQQRLLRNYIYQLTLNPNHTFQAGSISKLRAYTGMYSLRKDVDENYQFQRQNILNQYDNQPINRIDPINKTQQKYTAIQLKTIKIDRLNKKLDEKAAAFKAKLLTGFTMDISNM